MPPDGVAVALPVLRPKPVALTDVAVALSAAEGCVMVTLLIVVHPLASVAVTL